MASGKNTTNMCIADEWLEEDKLMLLECWSRDGYTYQDIANKIGISGSTLTLWKKQYPEIMKALRQGREIIDYKVENALLKSALGYHTREVKVTTTMRYGKVVETIKETTDKEQAPNVSAIQCWLYNRLPQKWKKNRDNIINLDEEDSTIQVTVTRANKSESHQKAQPPVESAESEVDEEWQDTINNSITIRKATKEEQAQSKAKRAQQSSDAENLQTKVENEASDEDLDYWPDDWEEDEEDWEE